MPEAKRAMRPEPLDTASEHMAEILRRADGLLAEWSQFGAAVRTQVEREAQQIGAAVCDATEQAVRRAAAEGTSRAISDQLGKQLAALSTEVGKLETRARAASRAIAEQRRGDRALLYGLAVAVLIANVFLVVLLLRNPTRIVVEPVPVAAPLAPAAVAPAAEVPSQGSGSAVGPDAPIELQHEPGADSKRDEPKRDLDAAKGAIKPVIKQGPPAGAKPISEPARGMRRP
ncbi:MAG: hypothetical protein H0V17_01975 [Deltaproteobacteria bacterium]|nr:hypothetical protein [Deltaproteobacteria bacterium]